MRAETAHLVPDFGRLLNELVHEVFARVQVYPDVSARQSRARRRSEGPTEVHNFDAVRLEDALATDKGLVLAHDDTRDAINCESGKVRVSMMLGERAPRQPRKIEATSSRMIAPEHIEQGERVVYMLQGSRVSGRAESLRVGEDSRAVLVDRSRQALRKGQSVRDAPEVLARYSVRR